MKKSSITTWLWIFLVGVSPVLVSFFIFELYRYPLSVPFGYQGDAYFSAFIIKHILTHGFTFTNSQLGFPFQLTLFDFPFADGFYFALTKIIGIFSHDPFLVSNLHQLVSFVMISLTAWVVWRQLDISKWFSWWGSLLFSFLPYHLIRGPYHVFVSNYWLVPLVCYLSLWLINTQAFPLPSLLKRGWQKWVSLAMLCFLIAGSGIYYALFSIFLFVSAGMAAVLYRKDWSSMLTGLGLAILISLGITLQFLPSIAHSQLVGPNPEAGERHGFEADLNSLSLLRISMPLQDIGLAGMRDHVFKPAQPLIDMEQRQFLGWGGLLGVLLIFYQFVIKGSQTSKKNPIWYALFFFCTAVWILAMPGGVGTILAFALSPQIRAYGRILPFFAFFALTGLLIWLDSVVADRLDQHQVTRRSFFATLIVIGSFWSQIRWYQVATPFHIESFTSDQAFFAQIDQLQPRAVYQLPYKAFPETPNLERLSDYDLLKGYLHTDLPTAWSYASMKGRPEATWHRGLSQFPIEVQLGTLREVGFDGLYLDRYGWADNGAAIEASLSGLINKTPLISKDGRLVYYQLKEKDL